MGYSAFTFPQKVAKWLEAGWLFPGAHLIKFGSQEFFGDVAANRQSVRDFLRARGIGERDIESVLAKPSQPLVADIYRCIGVDYTSIDMDGARGSLPFDLNVSVPPETWRNVFDFVNNEGTAKHLANPINAYHVAHDIVKVGGVIFQSLPLIGHQTHGLFNPTSKFCSRLISDNDYELLRATAAVSQTKSNFDDNLFREVLLFCDGGGQTSATVTDICGLLAYRKVRDAPFVIPTDLPDVGNSDAIRERLNANYRSFAAARSKLTNG
jgi:SAM-dependent methyltransferase